MPRPTLTGLKLGSRIGELAARFDIVMGLTPEA